MEYDPSDVQSIGDTGYIVNITCNHDYVPSASEYIDSEFFNRTVLSQLFSHFSLTV